MSKSAIALLVGFAVAAGLHVEVHPGIYDTSFDNQNVTLKQNLIQHLLTNVSRLNTYPELSALGKSWNPERHAYRYVSQDVVTNFMTMWKQGTLPRGEIFRMSNDSHMEETVALFHLLNSAKDFETFIGTAAWARDNVNEGQFVFAVTAAVVNRHDCHGVVLPSENELLVRASDIDDFFRALVPGSYENQEKLNGDISSHTKSSESLSRRKRDLVSDLIDDLNRFADDVKREGELYKRRWKRVRDGSDPSQNLLELQSQKIKELDKKISDISYAMTRKDPNAETKQHYLKVCQAMGGYIAVVAPVAVAVVPALGALFAAVLGAVGGAAAAICGLV